MQKKYLMDFVEGDPITQTFLVVRSQLRTASNGAFYIDLELCDKSGKMSGKFWKATREIFDTFGADDFVQVRAVLEKYRENRQLRVDSIIPVKEEHVNIADFLPCTDKEIEPMLKSIKDTIATVESEPLRALLQAFFNDAEFVGKFCTAPAAVTYHHPYLGGLLEHTSTMLEMGLKMLETRPELNRDHLLAGLILHDIGKIEEFAYDRSFRYTDRGKLLGHLVIGSEMIRDRAAAIPDFAPRELELLLHLVLSHHGEHAYGAPRLPVTAEAVAVHHIDNLDAKLKVFEQMKRNATDPDAIWSEFSKMFQRELYIGSGQREAAEEE